MSEKSSFDPWWNWFSHLSRGEQAKEIIRIQHINKKALYALEATGLFYPVGFQRDYFNVYAYGNEIKVVYMKCGVPHRKPRESAYHYQPSTVDKTELSESEKTERFASSLSRTKATVFEIAACNEFTHFATLTLNKEMYDRNDLSKFRKDLAQYVRNLNRNRRDNPIKYLEIPELHKAGGWHIHGLFKGLRADDLRAFELSEKLPRRIKDMIRSGRAVYDWSGYSKRFGFTTITEIVNAQACAHYVTKYITKDLQKTVLSSGSHMFFASQGLNRREVILHNCFGTCPFTDFDFENKWCKIKTIKLS